MKPKQKIIVLFCVLSVIAATAAWRIDKEKEDSPKNLTLYGNVEIRDAQLAFKDRERISSISVDEGDRVTKGQVLAQQDTKRLQARIKAAEASMEAEAEVVKRLDEGTRREVIRQAYAQLAAARVRYENATQRLERLKQTTAGGATSQQDLDDARTQVKVQRAQLKAAREKLDLDLAGPRTEDIQQAKALLEAKQQELNLLRIQYAETTLRAPSAGVVRSRILEPGEIAGPDVPVLTLALTDPKWVRAYIPEPDLGRIAPGNTAEVTSDSYPKAPFTGWIGFISPEAEFTPRSVETADLRTKLVYEVRVYVKDPQDHLRLGAPVTVTLDQKATGGR
jgi:HlyD family secretion protein